MRRVFGYIWGTVAVLVLWWALGVAVDSPALPTPDATIPVLIDNAASITPDFFTSFWRILASMLIGTALGAPIGLILGRSQRADRIIEPILYILYPIPKIVFLPVIFVFFGLGGEGKIVIISIAVLFQMVVSMRDAARSIPESAMTAVRSLGVSRLQTFTNVVLPATLPALFTALRVTTGTAVAILFIAESMAGSTGLGYYIMHSWSLLEYTRMFAGIVAMAIMGVIIYEAFYLAERRLNKA